jgi:hypothetical protein
MRIFRVISIVAMHNIKVFKRQKDGWHPRPTGGADPNPGLSERVQTWLKSDFAQNIINKSVGQ